MKLPLYCCFQTLNVLCVIVWFHSFYSPYDVSLQQYQYIGVYFYIFTEDGALQVLPVVQELGMNRLKKKCDSVILTDLQTGPVLALPDILEHLATADEYDLPLTKTFCIEQCALHQKLVERDQIKDEKHITEKTKVEILDKMLDNVTTRYEKHLTQIRTDMDSRCREIEKFRDEFMEQTELWKNELGEKVMKTSKTLGEAHTKLLEASYKTDLFKNLNSYIAFCNDQITKEFEHLRNKIIDLADIILEKTDLKNPGELKATLEDELRKTKENTNLIKLGLEEKIASGIKTCAASSYLQTSLTENFELLEKLDQFSTTLVKKTKMLTVLEIKESTLEEEFQKLESEHRKCLKRLHDINTWIRWAKPDRDGEGCCTCFRHSYSRYSQCLKV